jgi:hypothetical protein
MTNYFWKVWLRPNFLTPDVDNDYVADVSTVNTTRRNEDIARAIIEQGSEIHYDTLVSILNRADGIVHSMLQQGESVQTGVCHLKPLVAGAWLGTNARYNPDTHKITLTIIPTAATRQALAQVGVEVLGVKEGGAYIGLVTDTATGLTDGTITPNDDVLIQGDKIRIAPDNEAGTGVFFVDATGEAIPVTRRLTQNDPKTLIARVPDLPAGNYTLRVVTRFTSSGHLLNDPRTIEYAQTLVVN